ncbi:short-chain fatty acid transporter [Natronococcus wangiae]|uniref:short-chain fatty acid transporter n=1 Tax=Natronococcus wangiae TaxID=3068275 RepID=UPI0027400A16|nr:TIGR00366 family protein [Natronococcus sp. AD5]
MATADTNVPLLERVGERLADWVERWMPSPFLFAILLTYIVYLVGLVATPSGPVDLVEHWYGGFWSFLEFAMQMTLILMTGFVVAYHPRVNAFLTRLTELPSNGKQAVVLVGVFAMVLGWIHWGLSLILGAVLAREMGKTARENGIAVHYPLVCVAAYMGLGLTWHWGLSGSAPLLLATPENEFIQAGIVADPVPITTTVLHPFALTLAALSIIYASLVLYLLAPSPERSKGIEEYVSEDELLESATDGGATDDTAAETATGSAADGPVPAERIDNSRVLGGVIALTGVAVVGYNLVFAGLDVLDINFVNFAVLFVGLLVYQRPARYRERFGEAATAAAGIILLFPFFAGIQGMMADSGLATLVAEELLAISTPETFPVIAWLAAGIVNAFVPSGGGEWIVLGPSVLEAAEVHGVPFGHATMAYAVGDAHTNLLNPFWAIPLLAITKIKAREMFGYGIAVLLALFPFLAVALYLVPY